MAGSVNKCILVGNLGKDPEIRTTQSGQKIASLRIATSESWKDKNTGERREKTEWHSVVIFNENLVKIAEAYIRKGSKVYVEGQLQTRKWQDQQGQERYSTEIVLQGFNGRLTILDGHRDEGEPQQQNHSQSRSQAPASSGGSRNAFGNGGSRGFDDEIPF